MKGATEEELVQATDNLRRYLKAMYALYRALQVEDAGPDSPQSGGDGRFTLGAEQPPQL